MLRSITYILCVLLLITLNSAAMAITAEDLFNNNCASCHRTPEAIRKSEAVISNALKPGAVRKHHFILSEEEKTILIQYLSVATNK